MKQLINGLFVVLRILLLLAAMGLIFYGLLLTYTRLDKSVTDSIPIMLPFVLLLIMYIINLMGRQKIINRNFFYNITAVIVLGAIVYIGYRAKFDTNMMLYYKYGINYSPSYLSDNLGTIKLLIYLLFISDLVLVINYRIFREKKVVKEKVIEVVEELPKEEVVEKIKTEETVNA